MPKKPCPACGGTRAESVRIRAGGCDIFVEPPTPKRTALVLGGNVRLTDYRVCLDCGFLATFVDLKGYHSAKK